MQNYCKCGLHCRKYGMNAFYCRKQFLRNPVDYVPIEIIPNIVPDEYVSIIDSMRIYKKEIGKISPLVIMRRFKMTFDKAKEIMKYL